MILEGKTLSSQIRAAFSERVKNCEQKLARSLKVAGIAWQGGYASYLYLKKEIEAAEKIGIKGQIFEIAENTTLEEMVRLVRNLSADPSVDAVLIPKPLPKHLDVPQIWEAVAADKDIDGSCPLNVGRLFLCKTAAEIAAMQGFTPCTAKSVLELLKYHKVPLSGAEIAVIGRSSTVGKPAAHMLSCENATVKICHSKTKDIAKSLLQADIVVCAIGVPRFLQADMIKEGAIVVDVGTNQDCNGVYCGDVNFDEVSKKASKITPVPGGVGPLTLTFLLENIVISAERKIK
jgi:methylenetetrahydrofolate dehydrogenase (NADP+)/methenyltetrahydrofolate cyclohydrolase